MKCVLFAGVLFVLVGLGACSIRCRCFNCECTIPGKQAAAISSLRNIHNAQAQYQEKYNRFGTLKELTTAGLISANYANGQPVIAYVYADAGGSAETYCVSATRVERGWWAWLRSEYPTYRDFIVCEDGVIHTNEASQPRTLQRGEGQPISESQP